MRASVEDPRASRWFTVKLESTETENVRLVRILADLDDTEESVAIVSQVLVDRLIDGESQGAAYLLELVVLEAESLILLPIVSVVNSGVKNGPASASSRAFEVPVHEDVGGGVAVTKGVVSWHQSALEAEVNTHE